MGTLANQADNIDLDKTEDVTDGDTGGRADNEPKGSGEPDAGATADKPAEDGAGASDKGPEGDTDGDTGSDADKDAGYLADESTDDESEPDEVTEEAPKGQLTPELQYIVDNLPTLSVRDKSGKTYQVKAAGQLPETFEFANKREELLFNQSLIGQEAKARELQNTFQQNQQREASDKFAENENRDIRSGIGDLQREGKIPRFKLEPDDPKFADDPGVKQAQEVIDHMNKLNGQYLSEYQKNGGVLYHIDFKTAYNDLQANRPADTKKTAQDQEDRQRRQVTRANAGAQGAPSVAMRGKPARSMREIIDSLDLREFS